MYNKLVNLLLLLKLQIIKFPLLILNNFKIHLDNNKFHQIQKVNKYNKVILKK